MRKLGETRPRPERATDEAERVDRPLERPLQKLIQKIVASKCWGQDLEAPDRGPNPPQDPQH